MEGQIQTRLRANAQANGGTPAEPKTDSKKGLSAKGGSVQTEAEVQRQIPDDNTAAAVPRTTIPQPSLFSRSVRAFPGACASLLSSSWRVIKENLIEGLVTYAVFSVAPNLAQRFAAVTGLNFNGTLGWITVSGRKMLTALALGVWNCIPSMRGRGNNTNSPNNGNNGVNAPAVTMQRTATGSRQPQPPAPVDDDLPTGLNGPGVNEPKDSDQKTSNKDKAPRRKKPRIG